MNTTETKTVTTGLPTYGFDEEIAFEGATPLRLDEIIRDLEESKSANECAWIRRTSFPGTSGAIFGEPAEMETQELRRENVTRDAAAWILCIVAEHVAATSAIEFGERTRLLAPFLDVDCPFDGALIHLCSSDVKSKPLGLMAAPDKKWWDKIESLKTLKDGWDSYRAPAPSSASIAQATVFLEEAAKSEKAPSRLAPSVVGGVGVTFKCGTRKVYAEFRNTGSVHALFSDSVGDPVVEKIGPNRADYVDLMARIKKYLNE